MAITAATRTDIIKYVVGMFDAAPGSVYLNELVSFIEAGNSTAKLVDALTKTSIFTSSAYYPAYLTNTEFATKFVNALVGNAAADAEKQWAIDWMAGMLNAGKSRAEVIKTAIDALDSVKYDDAKWGKAAQQFDNQVKVAEYYSVTMGQAVTDLNTLKSVIANVTAETDVSKTSVIEQVISSATGVGMGQTATLTVNQDIINGTSGNDVIRGVAGKGIGNQDQTTLNSSDIIDGGAGDDSLVLLLNGPYGGGATIKNVETLQIGTNSPAVTFDYNVNQGRVEITDVRTIVADQINQGEALIIANLLKTGAELPALHWKNEAGSTAGKVKLEYRASAVDGATEQKVILENVRNGQLDIGRDVETLRIVSSGTGPNTLKNTGIDENNKKIGEVDSGVNDVLADLISHSALTKVILEGSVPIGFRGDIITDPLTAAGNLGLTDKLPSSDNGISDGRSDRTEANLLSVGSRVTEVDASAMTGSANVRFTAKKDGSATNVTFKGGQGNDYVEFELGNVNATGGKGDDVFAFINNGFNATFTNADTIDGGEGVDTILLGMNGVGTITLQSTEFANKKGIDVLDIRAERSNIELRDGFVAAADSGFTVRTDRIVQTSLTDPANPSGAVKKEDNSAHALDLRMINDRPITYKGGSGSDRIIVNEQGFATGSDWDGGAGTSIDTITVMDNAVLSRGDLEKVKGFEGLVLVKSAKDAVRSFTIELTADFLKNNALNADQANTPIKDTIFQIGTADTAGGFALQAGDKVTIDITDLISNQNVFDKRRIDVSLLEKAGVKVEWKNAGKDAGQDDINKVKDVDQNAKLVMDSAGFVTEKALPLPPLPPLPAVLQVNIPVPTNKNVVADNAKAEAFVVDIVKAKADNQAGVVTQFEIQGFAVAGNAKDVLVFDMPQADANITTLAQLNGKQGVAIQNDPFKNALVINFGNDLDGEAVAVTLTGVIDPAQVAVQII